MGLIDYLIEKNWLKSPEIIKAFRKIKRVDFIPEENRNLSEINEALPIGFGQTISQPLVVAFMIEQLDPKKGDKILDIGAGSGWTSALLAEVVGEKGKIISIERIPELFEFGKKNVSKYNFLKKKIIEFICADGSKGYPNIVSYPGLKEGFDKILCSATLKDKIPEIWKEELKEGGRIVCPIGHSIWCFIKRGSDFEKEEYPGFSFVPLVNKG